MAAVTAVQRLLYPAAALLLSASRTEYGLGLLVAALGLALLRSYLGDVAVHRLRASVFQRLGVALRSLPVFWPPAWPPMEQLGAQAARGAPWVELHFCHTLPLLLGNALALPALAVLAWGVVDPALFMFVLAALVVAGALASVAWAKARREGVETWRAYRPVAATIDRGVRSRLELRVHDLGSSYEAKLQEQVAHWAKLERRARRGRSFTGFSLPVFALAATALLAMALGFDVEAWLHAALFERNQDIVGAGITLAFAVPILVALSRGLADAAHERSYIDALHVVFESPQQGQDEGKGPEGPVGDVLLTAARFVFARDEEEPVVVQADLHWRSGESLALLGPNGAGKTSVALAVMGMLRPHVGTCTVRIGDAWHDTTALSGLVASLFQTSFFAEHETVCEAVRFLAPNATEREIEVLFSKLFPAFNVGKLLQQRVAALSAGQQRLVALARVLLRRAPLVILDEPEANLDIAAVERVLEVLREVSRQQRLLILTHDVRFTEVVQRVLEFGEDRVLRDPTLNLQGEYTRAAEHDASNP